MKSLSFLHANDIIEKFYWDKLKFGVGWVGE